MSKLTLTLACWNYDRTRALVDGRVRPDGIDLNCLNLPVEETFFRMARHHEFDAAEMSLSSYVVSLFAPDPPFIAIPVFPSRSFRHSCVFVHAASGIREPKDLIGRRIGCPEYQLTACVWIRGTLADDYGVPVASATYVVGGQEQRGRPEKLSLDLPAGIRVERIGADETLSSLLALGGIDALLAANRDDVHFSDHARRRDSPRGVRTESMDRAVALQGVLRGAARDVRGPVRNRRAEDDAAVADGSRRGDAP